MGVVMISIGTRKHPNNVFALGFLAVFYLVCASAFAATFDVDSVTDAPASSTALAAGICDDGQGQCTLRAAIQVADQAPSASTINVPAGTYTLTVPGVDESYSEGAGPSGGYTVDHTPNPAQGDLNITQSMAIVGAGSAQTIIGWAAGSKEDRVFHIETMPDATTNITVSLQGITVENGYVPPPVDLDTQDPTAVVTFVRSGGGIAIGTSAAIVTTDTTATHGGGGGGGGGEEHGGPGGDEGETTGSVAGVALSDVRVLNNTSGGDGGGIYNVAPLTADHVVVTGNTSAANGGGIYDDAAMSLTYGLIGDSSAPNSAENGGGLFETGSHASYIEKSAMIGNAATGGGGIASRSLVVDYITNTTIAGNTAQDTGAGMITNGEAFLTNDTVANNTIESDAEGGGAGLNSFGSGSYTLVNTLLLKNVLVGATTTAANCGVTGSSGTVSLRFHSEGHNLEDANTCQLSAVGDLPDTTGTVTDPLAENGGFTPTMALPQSSPAVDAGDNSRCPNDDQRDQIRPAAGTLSHIQQGVFLCDIGAFELFVPVADLDISNMTAPDQVYATDDFTVTAEVHVGASANQDSTDVVITTDPIPADLSVNSAEVVTPGSTQPVACAVSSQQVVSCPVGTLKPDESATMALNLKALSPVSTPVIITATVTQSSAIVDPDTANNTASMHVAVIGNSDLSISATGSPTPVNVGSDTDMNFTVSNGGPDTANNIEVGIELPSGVTYQSVDLPGATCTYDGSAQPATVLCTLPDLVNGDKVTGALTVSGAVEGSATTTFAAEANERDADLTNNQVNTTLTILGLADLGLVARVSPTTLDADGNAAVILSVANKGPTDATGVQLDITLPTGVTYNSATGAKCTASGGKVICQLPDIGVDATSVVTLMHTVTASSGTLSWSATVSGTKVDPVSANNAVTTSAAINAPSTNGGSSGGGGGSMSLFGLAILLLFLELVRRVGNNKKINR